MFWPRDLKGCLTCAVLVCAAALLWEGRSFIAAQRGVGQSEAALLRELVGRELLAARGLLQSESLAYRTLLDRQLTGTRGDLNVQLHALMNEVAIARQDTTTEIRAIREETAATLRETQALQASARRGIELVTPQVLGATAAAKVALGETAQAARRFDDNLPAFIVTWKGIGENVNAVSQKVNQNADTIAANSNRITEASAKTMENIAEATRPLPRWVRLPLNIAGAVAPYAIGAFK